MALIQPNGDFSPHWQHSFLQLLHIHDEIPSFHHMPKVLYWTDIWGLWRTHECSELIVIFKKAVSDDLKFVTYNKTSCHLRSGNYSVKLWRLNDVQMVPRKENISHTTTPHYTITPQPQAQTVNTRKHAVYVVYVKFWSRLIRPNTIFSSFLLSIWGYLCFLFLAS